MGAGSVTSAAGQYSSDATDARALLSSEGNASARFQGIAGRQIQDIISASVGVADFIMLVAQKGQIAER